MTSIDIQCPSLVNIEFKNCHALRRIQIQSNKMTELQLEGLNELTSARLLLPNTTSLNIVDCTKLGNVLVSICSRLPKLSNLSKF